MFRKALFSVEEQTWILVSVYEKNYLIAIKQRSMASNFPLRSNKK